MVLDLEGFGRTKTILHGGRTIPSARSTRLDTSNCPATCSPRLLSDRQTDSTARSNGSRNEYLMLPVSPGIGLLFPLR